MQFLKRKFNIQECLLCSMIKLASYRFYKKLLYLALGSFESSLIVNSYDYTRNAYQKLELNHVSIMMLPHSRRD